MKKLVKVVELRDQESRQSQGPKDLLVRGFIGAVGNDEMFIEVFNEQVIASKDILDASVGKYVWVDLSFSVRRWEKDGKTYFSQSIYGRNVTAF